ncbi:hypothetical protein [Levilactobacillus tujiorum]|uniref:Uncharacterized protein n=1 Tax=Levilactobacillus tujiorum TaxID=2912243 RepID=A0ABX1L2U1_9LACO|nr:hypothetical protein [Levilactobacillus tujiorum]NLR12171.1 hypothetical protein [Lactobacillus sp. HBUAS51387]NLR28583.1 hypothetical protein [Levilactobacillus tujiorum]
MPNFTGSTLASYRFVSWIFLGISWWCQLESITWWTIQPVRSLRELVIFTGLAVMLTVGTSLFKTVSWSGTAAFMRDLNFIFLFYVSLMLFLPRAVTVNGLNTPAGRAGLICMGAAIFVGYLPPDGINVPRNSGWRGNYPAIQRGLVKLGRVLLILGSVAAILAGRS